jgi:hypothetical protein
VQSSWIEARVYLTGSVGIQVAGLIPPENDVPAQLLLIVISDFITYVHKVRSKNMGI